MEICLVNLFLIWLFISFSFLQTNPFDLFEAFFGSNIGNFSTMDQSTFRTRKRGSALKGEDIR